MRFSPLLTVALLTFALPAMAQQQAAGTGYNYETRLSNIEDEMRATNGQVEQLSFAIRRLDQSLQRLQTDYDARLARLETSVATLTANDDARTAAANAKAAAPLTTDGSLGAIKTQPDGRVIGAISNPQAPPLPDTPPDYGMTPQEEYDHALGLLRQADYDGAEKEFKTFIDKNPKDKMIDNARYWHAETLYVRGRFMDAATAFAEAFQQNPQSAKAPDCLLKLGKSLAAVNKNEDACTALAQIKNKYPNASATLRSQASEERSKLKCGG